MISTMIALLAGYSLIASNIFAALVRYRIIVQLLSTSMHHLLRSIPRKGVTDPNSSNINTLVVPPTWMTPPPPFPPRIGIPIVPSFLLVPTQAYTVLYVWVWEHTLLSSSILYPRQTTHAVELLLSMGQSASLADDGCSCIPSRPQRLPGYLGWT